MNLFQKYSWVNYQNSQIITTKSLEKEKTKGKLKYSEKPLSKKYLDLICSAINKSQYIPLDIKQAYLSTVSPNKQILDSQKNNPKSKTALQLAFEKAQEIQQKTKQSDQTPLIHYPESKTFAETEKLLDSSTPTSSQKPPVRIQIEWR